MDINQSPINMFDRVRVHNTPLTLEKEVADLIGVVYGVTTPSNLELRGERIEIIGELTEDIAYGVHLEKFNETIWFASGLVDFVDYNPGFEISMGDLKAVRLETGEWQEQSGSRRRFQNESEMMQAVVKNNQEISTTRTSKTFWDWFKKIFRSN